MFESQMYGVMLRPWIGFPAHRHTNGTALCSSHLSSKPWPLEIVGIPITDQCELFIQRPRVDDGHCYYMHYSETLEHTSACWW